MARKIAVANQKGGVGKTTTAICLAQELIAKGYKVLFIDSDAQCNSTAFYGGETEGRSTLADILYGDAPAAECIQHTDNGDIIPADKALSDAETTVKVNERRFTHLKRSCKGIEDDYDYIIVDTPPHIGVALKNVLAYVDGIVIPVEETGWSLDGLMDFAEAIEMARDNNEKLALYGILTVKSKQRTKKAARIADLAEQIAEDLKTRRFKTKIRESVACAEAMTEFCVPLHKYAPKSTTYQDYRDFTDELLEVI